MTDLLSIGTTGLRAGQAGLGAIAHNIANVATPGYARRRIDTTDLTVGNVRAGTRLTVTSRLDDVFATRAARLGAGDAALTTARARWADADEAALGDAGRDLGTAADAVERASDRLGDADGATGMAGALATFADTARTTMSALQENATAIAASANDAADEANAILSELHTINTDRARSLPGSAEAASFDDRRDALIDRLAAMMDVGVQVDARGRTALTSGGVAILTADGPARIAVDGALAVTADGVAVPTVRGLFPGLARAAADNAALTARVATFASDFASAVNGWNGAPALSANGQDVAGPVIASTPLRTTLTVEWDAIAGSAARRAADARQAGETATLRHDTATAARDAISAVDLDTEAAMLVRYQQAYDAAARVIQTARETFDTLFRMTT